MLRTIAILFGIAFIFAGVVGFMPAYTQDGLLLGYFHVDFVHNVIHLATGVIAIMAATSYRYTRLYFQIFGFIYGLIAILGFVWQGDLSIIMLHTNFADNILHTIVAIVALYLGFYTQKA